MVSRLVMTVSAAVLGAGLLTPRAHAQTPNTFSFGPQGRGVRPAGGRGIPRRPPGGFGRTRPGQRGFRGAVILPPYYYYPYEGYEETSPPPKAPAQQAPQPAVPQPEQPAAPPTPPIESLLLQYQDGKWVRVPTGNQLPNGPLPMQPESDGVPSAGPRATNRAQAAEPQPATRQTELVFRDGRREKIQKYVIHGDAIYASVDYWKTGAWTKKILLSELNVPATLKLNRDRGVKFSLPTGPDEVVVGF